MSQALEIITMFTSELSNYLSSNIHFTEDVQTKKRKILVDSQETTSSSSHIMVNNNNNKILIEPVIILLVQFLKAFKSSANTLYKENFQKACKTFFTDFINPIILLTTTNLLTNNNKVDKSTYSKLVWTSLNLHHTLVDISDLYWKNTSSNNKHQFITNLQKITMFKDPKLILFMVFFIADQLLFFKEREESF